MKKWEDEELGGSRVAVRREVRRVRKFNDVKTEFEFSSFKTRDQLKILVQIVRCWDLVGKAGRVEVAKIEESR